MIEEISKLPSADRVKRYRELEQDALRAAKQSRGATADAFAQLAEAWARFAETTEEAIAKRASEGSAAEVEENRAALRRPRESAEDET